MDFWKSKFKTSILDINYEDLVSDNVSEIKLFVFLQKQNSN